jgi:type II secretory pathway pseudopilin PulG
MDALKSLKTKNGFTIIEVFTAISILVFCSAVFFLSLYIGFNMVNDTRENIIASSIIQQKIEGLRKTFFTSLPAYGESAFSSDMLSRLNNSSAKVNVDQYIDANIIRAAVTVAWDSRLNGSKHNVKKAVTLITRNGINSI